MLCRRKSNTMSSLSKQEPPALSQKAQLSCQCVANMIIVSFLQALISLNYSIMLPSLHQFVTNPTTEELHISDNEETNQLVEEEPTENAVFEEQVEGSYNQIRPGLGQSELFYSWVVATYCIGIFIGCPIAGQLVRLLSYRLCILIACSLLLLGSLLYAFTKRDWMIIVARFLLGVFEGFAIVILFSYVGKATIEQGHTSKKKWKKTNKHRKASTMRDKIYIAQHAFRGVLYMLVFGLLAVMVQFSSIDQFRWPGWCLAFVAVIYVCPVLLIFKESTHCMFVKHKADKENTKLKKSKSYNLCKDFNWRIVTAYCIIMFGSYVRGSMYPIMDTLLNPILSYSFGFLISEITYFMLAINIVAYSGSTLLFVILKCAKINNRIILIVVVCISTCGMLISCDWQSIGADPCYGNHINITMAHPSSPSLKMNGSGSGLLEAESTTTLSTPWQEPRSVHIKEHQYSLKEIHILANVCREASTDRHTCYWNQYSQFTGKLCSDCHPASCKSKGKTLNLVQFSIGITLVMTGIAAFQTISYLIAADYTPKRLQGTVISLMAAVSGIARIVTPVWGDWLFERLGKKTFPPLIVITTMLFLLLILLVVFHKQLKSHKVTAAAHPQVHSKKNNNMLEVPV